MELIYYKNLDGVRAIAALLVMLLHFFNHVPIDTPTLEIAFNFAKIGQVGVTIFFVLSGFLITRILLSNLKDENYFKNFYINRSLRIFPLYFLYLALYYFVFSIFIDDYELNDSLYYYVVYIQNIGLTFNWIHEGPGHFWSLAVEEHFYLFWPIVVFYLSRKKVQRIIFLTVLGCLLLRVKMLCSGYVVDWFTFTRIDSLMLGAFLAYREKNGMDSTMLKQLLLSLLYVVLSTVALTFFNYKGSVLFQAAKYLLWSLSFYHGIYCLILLSNDAFLNRLLESRGLRFTGKISYGLYVYHPFVYDFVLDYMEISNWIYSGIICLVGSYLIAGLSYYFVESYFLKMKRRS